MFSSCLGLLCMLGPVLAQDLLEKQDKFLAQHVQGMQANANVTSLAAWSKASSDSRYVTITPSGNTDLCIELPYGQAYNGNPLWLWACNGDDYQIWVNDNDQIRYGPDETFCVDAGGMSNGEQLMLWECNGLEQQTWGYDSDASRMYLSGTSTCLDWLGDGRQSIQIWECDGLSNQEWSLWGTGDPGTGGRDVFPSDHCQYDIGGWPSFQTEEDLQNDPYWSIYFIRIYGGVPSTGYPICPGAFQYLWKLSAAEAGVVEFDPYECSTGEALPGGDDLTGMELNPGTYFTGMSKALEGWDVAAYIYNPNFYGVAAPAYTWVEVSHIVFPGDKGAIWYYMSVGSGVWIYTGKTAVYKDHPDVVSDMTGQSCSDQANDVWGTHPTECEKNFNDVYTTAKAWGINTIQITDHYDCTCGPAGDSSFMHYRHCYTEIIAMDDPGGARKGCSSLLRGGWEASGDCNCDESFKSAAFDPVCKDGGCSYANCGAS